MSGREGRRVRSDDGSIAFVVRVVDLGLLTETRRRRDGAGRCGVEGSYAAQGLPERLDVLEREVQAREHRVFERLFPR